MTEAATVTPPDDPFRLRVAAISLADSAKTRYETDLAATKKRFQTQLGKATDAITALMPKHEADLPEDCAGRLVDLYKAHAEREKIEGAKKVAVDKLKASLKKAEAHLTALIRAKIEDRQTMLALGNAMLADGLGIANETARGLARTIVYVEQAGGTLTADEQRLKAALAASGVTFSLDDEDEPDDGAEDDDDDEPDEDDEEVMDASETEEPRLAVVQ
jgi:hypothetical protein